MKSNSFILLYLAATVDAFCMLCEDGIKGLLHPLTYTDKFGKNCATLAVDLASVDQDDALCKRLVNENRSRCCSSDDMAPIVQLPVIEPNYSITGIFNVCELCWNSKKPFNRNMVINMLYIGIGSCDQYYQYGQTGWIPTYLCSALQSFAFEPCGCNIL